MSGLFHVGSLGPWTDVTGSIYEISMITSLGSFYWHIFKQSDSFFGSVQSTDEHIKAFFIFVTVFLISVIFFLFFHRISISLPILFIFSWISFTLSIRNLNMWFVISKSLYDDSQICVISVLVLKMALFFQILFFSCLLACICFILCCQCTALQRLWLIIWYGYRSLFLGRLLVPFILMLRDCRKFHPAVRGGFLFSLAY